MICNSFLLVIWVMSPPSVSHHISHVPCLTFSWFLTCSAGSDRWPVIELAVHFDLCWSVHRNCRKGQTLLVLLLGWLKTVCSHSAVQLSGGCFAALVTFSLLSASNGLDSSLLFLQGFGSGSWLDCRAPFMLPALKCQLLPSALKPGWQLCGPLGTWDFPSAALSDFLDCEGVLWTLPSCSSIQYLPPGHRCQLSVPFSIFILLLPFHPSPATQLFPAGLSLNAWDGFSCCSSCP